MKTSTLLKLSMCVLIISGCLKSENNADRLALLSSDKKWSNAIARGDIEQIVSFWTEDAIVYFPDRPSVVGKTAIREMVRKNRSTPGFSLTTHPAEAIVSDTGDLGYTLGTFELSVGTPEDGIVRRNGNYVCIWRRQAEGAWKCSVEISNFRQ